MIPKDFITRWRERAPWPADAQVEQDLMISRALAAIFRDDFLREALALRGGTAIYTLHIRPPARYSEDIDLVQVRPEPIGETLNHLRSALDPWLGKPRRLLKAGRAQVIYRQLAEGTEGIPLRLKIEINTEEHFTVQGFVTFPFEVVSPWFSGRAEIKSYSLEELLGTKLRALYQRRKGRDLFDLWVGLRRQDVEPDRIVEVFRAYLSAEKTTVTRKAFEENLAAKVGSSEFNDDLRPLLAPGVRYDPIEAADLVRTRLVAGL